MLFNYDAAGKAITDLPEYVRTLDLVGYRFDEASLKEARDKIYEKLQVEPEPEEVMAVNGRRGSPLRPRADPSGIYVYYPPERSVWKAFSDELRARAEKAGLRLYTSLAAPSGSTRLEEVIYGVSRSSRKLPFSCFVDTSNQAAIDLVGAFALGAATALQRGVKRLFEAELDRAADILLWTEHTQPWRTKDEVIESIIANARTKPTSKGRR